MYRYDNSPDSEKAAAEYLIAFIRHLYSKGRNGYQVCDTLEIDYALLRKLITNKNMLDEFGKRDAQFVEELRASSADEAEFINKCRNLSLHYIEYYNRYEQYSDYLRNVGPWQRRHNFKDAVNYHYKNKKRYTVNDIDVLCQLNTFRIGDVAPRPADLPDRSLTPVYKFRIINDICDGHTLAEISERYNCSLPAISHIIEEEKITLPVTTASIETRVIKAIKDGYNLEQLTAFFKYFDAERIKELIKTHRILLTAVR